MKFLYFSVTVFEFLCDFFSISCWNFQADQEECKHCNAWLLCVWDQKHKLIRIWNPSIYKVEINWWNLRKGNYLTNCDLLNFCCFWISKKLYSQYLKQTRYWDKRSASKLYSPIHISDVIDFHQKPFHAFWVHLTFTVMIMISTKACENNYQYFNTSLTSTDTMEVSSFGHWQVAGGRKISREI